MFQLPEHTVSNRSPSLSSFHDSTRSTLRKQHSGHIFSALGFQQLSGVSAIRFPILIPLCEALFPLGSVTLSPVSSCSVTLVYWLTRHTYGFAQVTPWLQSPCSLSPPIGSHQGSVRPRPSSLMKYFPVMSNQ